MFEGAVAGLLNRLLGKYVQDLDTEHLNVGVFSGSVNLADLKLKPEALYELDLPIDVKIGTIGRINLQIPWTALYTQPVIVNIEDVLILVGPAISNSHYDPEREKRLMRAAKRKILQDLESESQIVTGPQNFFEHLFTAIVNNLQIYVRNIHVRYEDSISSKDGPMACGLCLQSLSIETTNSKWKPSVTPVNASSVYQLMRVESLSLYWNPAATVLGAAETADITPMQYYNWKHYMITGLDKFAMHQEDFDFLLKPVTCKVKVIMSRSEDTRAPRLLVDAVLQDSALQLSRAQRRSMKELCASLKALEIGRKYRHLHPGVPLLKDTKRWWRYAYKAVVEQRIKPYTWEAIKRHRENYVKYKQTYKSVLRSPNDTELKLDLQQCEDSLPIVSIVIAREHAKIELLNQEPSIISVVESEYEWWRPSCPSPTAPSPPARRELRVRTERARSLWSHLSSPEKKKVCELIGHVEGGRPDKPKQYIEHKINLTLANCSLSLTNRGKEVMVVTLTQFLTSLETRPSAKAYKLSARAESIVIEGLSSDGELTPLISPTTNGSTTTSNLLSMDFEKNPMGLEADYSLSVAVEPADVMYNEHAITELLNLFQTTPIPTPSHSQSCIASCMWRVCRSGVSRAVSRRTLFHLHAAARGARLVLPEAGGGRTGKIIVLDIERVLIKSELQPTTPALEDATCMELEERLYDRLHAECTLQVLFCEASAPWREASRQPDSDLHLVPKMKAQVVFSNSIKKDYKLLPGYKMNVSLSSLKLNLSDQKICLLLDFLDNLPIPSPNTVADLVPDDEGDPAMMHPGYTDLLELTRSIHQKHLPKPRLQPPPIKAVARFSLERMASASFDAAEFENIYSHENVSPANKTKTLLRLLIGEIVINLSRSTAASSKAYLTFSLQKLCIDISLLDFGPAIQLSVQSASLVDKQHLNSNGQYLEVFGCESSENGLLNLSYRKVRADCPDFRSHFHSVERSLVAEVGDAFFTLHAGAARTAHRYLEYIVDKIQARHAVSLKSIVVPKIMALWDLLIMPEDDPPVPPGATKFSYLVRVSSIKLKLCHLESPVLQLSVFGVESEFVFRADDKFQFKLLVMALRADDPAPGDTLYPALIWPDEDKVFEMKYVRSTPKFYSDQEPDNVKANGELRVYLGRLHVVLFCSVLQHFLQFLEPLVPSSVAKEAVESAQNEVKKQVDSINTKSVRLHLAIEIHAPVLLLPPKPSSPALLVLNMGDLTVENFFKRVKMTPESTSPSQDPIIDNILVKLDNVTLSRAVMTLTANMEVQEPILEPFSLRLDVKRLVSWGGVKDLPRLACACVAEAPSIQLARRDLAALCRLREDLWGGLGDGGLVVDSPEDIPSTDTTVQKLQEFFAQGEPVRKEIIFRFTLEGLEIKLFTDMDEVLSSPVRDMNHALAKLTAGEMQMNLDSYSDKSIEITATLQSLSLEDISGDQNTPVKIFESMSANTSTHGFCVQRPPLVDLGARRGPAGGSGGAVGGGAWGVDVRVDKSRTNLAPAFLLQVARTLLDALPGDRSSEGGVVNHGYVGDSLPRQQQRDPDSVSGYYCNALQIPDETPGLSISIQFRQPEIMFFSDQSKSDSGHALLLRAELLIDYSSHSNTENLVISLASLQMISKLQSKLTKLPPQMVLRPCDIEFSKSLKNVEDGVKINLSISEVDLDLAPSTVHTVMDIIEEISTELAIPEEKEPFQFTTSPKGESDLWSPKKVTCPWSPPGEDIPPPRGVGGCGMFVVKCGGVKARMRGAERGQPLLQAEMQLDLTLYDWSKLLHGSGRLALQADVFDCSLRRWQPLIERVAVDENMAAMWTVNATVFQAKSYIMSSKLDSKQHPIESEIESATDTPKKSRPKSGFESETSADEVDSDNEMVFIRSNANTNKREYNPEFGGFLGPTDGEESDSDNENGLMDKLATAIGHLFTDDSSGEDNSNDESSAGEPSDADEPHEPHEPGDKASLADTPRRSKTVTLQEPEREDSIDSGLDTDSFDERPATYLILDSSHPLNITLSGECAKSLCALFESVEKRTVRGVEVGGGGLRNDIGPGARVQLISRRETDLAGNDRIVATADYLLDTSRPSTPGGDTSSADMLDDAEIDDKPVVIEEEDEWECFEDAFSSNNSAGGTSLSPRSPLSAPILYSDVTAERLRIQLTDFDELTVLCPQRSFQKLHVLHPSKHGTRYYVAVERAADLNARWVTVRSPLQIRNETCYALELYYKKTDLQAIGVDLIGSLTNPFDDKMRLCTIQPDDTYNVPLYIAYHCHLYLLPANFESYQTTSQGIWWADLAKDPGCARDVICPAKDSADSRIFAMRVLTVEGIQSPKVTRSIPNYLIRLVPPLTIYNRLPYALEVSAPALQYTARIEPGGKTYAYIVDLAKTWRFNVDVNYMGLPWSGGFNLSPDLTDKSISMVTECETEGGNKQLCACAAVERAGAAGWDLYLYAPYWIINKTTLPMQMKSTRSDTIYELTEEPVLWAARGRGRAGGRGRAAPRVRLRAHQSSWTRAARLVPSAPGLLDCSHRERRMHYRQLLQVTLSELCPQLTKIVTILPFFLVYNETRRHLRYMEEDETADLWLELAPSQCAPWWPRTSSMRMRCRLRDSATASQHFPVAERHRTVLRMDKGSAITVEVAGGTDSPFTITYKSYSPGDAPVRVDNLCDDLFLKLQQAGSGQATLLSPDQSVLYTWDEPAHKRELLWHLYNNKGEGHVADFSTDGYGEVKVSFHSIKHPTLIATNSVTSKLSSTFKRLTPRSPEPCESSSDDTDSDLPETPKNKKIRKAKVIVYWVSFMDGYQRVFALTQDERIAYQYRKRINSERSNFEIYLSLSAISLSACIQTKSGMKELAYLSATDSLPRWEVNVSRKWKQLSPDLTTWIEDKYKTDQKKCQLKEYIHIDLEKMQMTKPFYSELRRTYNPGVWFQYRKSDTYTYTHFKLHRLQIDNQLSEAVFPTVLYPASSTLATKPSLEFVSLKQHRPVQNQDVYKYFKVLLQQHYLNLDRGFINHVFDILNEWKVEGKPAVRLRADLALVHMPLPVIAIKNQVTSRNVVFEFLHLSNIKVVLSLSSRGCLEASRSVANQENCSKLFNSDLLEYLFNSWGSVLCDMKDVNIKMSHLELRAAPLSFPALAELASRHYWSQLLQQAHVLLLGLDVLGNPWAHSSARRSSQVPASTHDIAHKLSSSAAALLGHCAGAGSGVFSDAPRRDPGFKPDTLEKINDIPEVLLEMSRSHPASIALALSGLVARPTFDEDAMFIAHASREASLCRQLGADTEAAIRASIERGALVARRRLPRHCGDIEGLRPYSLHAALGLQLLWAVSRASAPEQYVAHAPLPLAQLLITTRHIYLVRGGGAGAWRAEWAVRLDDLIGVPDIDGDKLVLTIKQDEVTSYFSTDEKAIEIGSPELLTWLQARVECALIANMEDKRCPHNL